MKRKDRKEIEKREAAMAGSNLPKSKMNRKSGSNWREKQRRFANRGSGRTAAENKRRKQQKHHRGDGYFEHRREKDPEWSDNAPSKKAEKKGWKRFY